MLIIEVGRTAEKPEDCEQRKLASDPARRLLGIRQNEYRGRQIILLHTVQAWDPLVQDRRQVHITEDIDFAASVLDCMVEFVKRCDGGTDLDRQDRINLAAHGKLAIAGIKAITAQEMKQDAGKWIAITEATDAKKRALRNGTGG